MALVRPAFEVMGVTDFPETAFPEWHGTDSKWGDIHFGSVKPNLGHSEGASGLASLIETVVALKNRINNYSMKA